MDAKRFDQIAKTLSTAGPRRDVLHLLAGLPFGGMVAFLLGAESDAKRRKQGRAKGKQRAGSENHKHEGRRRKHKPHHKHDDKKPCKPESAAQTCDGKCGSVPNNCQKTVDCGSCACDPACSACQICDPAGGQCQPDPGQDGQSCGGCRVCDTGQCVTDPSIVCTPLDQCHETGVCDPTTGACTNPVKTDDTACDDGNPYTVDDACQNGMCIGTAKDCSAESDNCNDGVCRAADGVCIKDPLPDATPCGANSQCRGGVCEEVDPRQVIGSATKAITRADACGTETGRLCESLIGDVITDAMRFTYGTDFALTNSGGIRADLTCPPEGSVICPSGGEPNQITRGQVLSVLPFGNVAVTLEVSGSELQAMLEAGVSQLPAPSAAFPQVSGLCVMYDISADPGQRVTGAVRQAVDGSCNGEAIALTDAAMYTMTTNDFTASGGDGYPNLIAQASLRDVLAQVVASFIAAESPLDPHIEGRIVCEGDGCPVPAAE